MLRRETAQKLAAIAVGIACISGARDASPEPEPMIHSVVVLGRSAPPADSSDAPEAVDPPHVLAAPVAWAVALKPINVENANTGAKASVRLYFSDGTIDPEALDLFERTAGDPEGAAPLDHRVVKLAIKAAYTNGGRDIVIVSAYRALSSGKHGSGEALDFKLRGMDSRRLAAYLRGYPRAGVGIYTHPRTQFVHLDVRDTSFHWLDGSPPGRTWREAPLADPKRAERDRKYTAESDLPN